MYEYAYVYIYIYMYTHIHTYTLMQRQRNERPVGQIPRRGREEPGGRRAAFF